MRGWPAAWPVWVLMCTEGPWERGAVPLLTCCGAPPTVIRGRVAWSLEAIQNLLCPEASSLHQILCILILLPVLGRVITPPPCPKAQGQKQFPHL